MHPVGSYCKEISFKGRQTKWEEHKFLRACKYEGNSIIKLQIVIEKNRMEIMTYKQHLFFNIISIQI